MYPCVCCGYLTISEEPGSYDICEICFWEDDPVQLRYPELAGGANKPSLIEGQKRFVQFGACEERVQKHVRPARDSDDRDPEWRPIDPAVDRFETFAVPAKERPGLAYFHEATGGAREGGRKAWPDDMTRLFWWRPNYWLLIPE